MIYGTYSHDNKIILIRSKDLRGKWYVLFQRVTVVSILLLIAIKASARLKRGISTKVIIKSSKSKIPRDFSSSFLLVEKIKQD